MNIAHILPSSAVFPLQKHNGRYEWVLRLARLQVAAGHTVTIFAGAGSTDTSPIIWRSINTLGLDKKGRNLRLLQTAFLDDSFDVFHSHFDSLHYLVADTTAKPVIVTQHWFPTEEFASDVSHNTRHNVIAVPVTQLMQQKDRELGIPAAPFIYHGVDLGLFSFTATHGDRLLFVGRIHPGKGIDAAVRYARESGSALDIIGKINTTELAYWNTIESFVDGEHIRYLGPKPPKEVAAAYRSAKAVLFPSKHSEAFGQVTIEAQACGTPVIISDVGPSRELVIDGKTGFICHTDADYLEAIRQVGTLNRHDCRLQAERFNIDDMVTAYTKLYERSINSTAEVLAQ